MACLRAGMDWETALRLDPLHRIAFLHEYSAQQQAAWEAAQAT